MTSEPEKELKRPETLFISNENLFWFTKLNTD